MNVSIIPYLGIDPSELRQRPRLSIRKELGDGLNVRFIPPALIRPLVELGVRVETGVIIVDPGNVSLVELLKDGPLWKSKDMEHLVVSSVPVGRA